LLLDPLLDPLLDVGLDPLLLWPLLEL